MNDGMPTERQLEAIERRVGERIRRRSALRARIAAGAAGAAVVVAAAALLPHLVPVTSETAAGSAARAPASARPSTEVPVRCHAGSGASSASRVLEVPAPATSASVEAACRRGTSPTAPLVVCTDASGAWQVFVPAGVPATLCERNGMTAR